MKPHIVMHKGVWHCGVPGSRCYGMGYTPVNAYIDWQLMSALGWRYPA